MGWRPLQAMAAHGLCSAMAVLAMAAAPTAMGQEQAQSTQRFQTLRPLPGQLDQTPVFNDNNPESIKASGILLSTFAPVGRAHPEAHLDQRFVGNFTVFSHHVYARPAHGATTAWLALLAGNAADQPVTITVQQAATALSQPDAPFLPLPSFLEENLAAADEDHGDTVANSFRAPLSTAAAARLDQAPLRRGLGGRGAIYAGPGSRVAGALVRGDSTPGLPASWRLPPHSTQTLLLLPIPTSYLDPPVNGRTTQLRLHSSGPVSLAMVAALQDGPPRLSTLLGLLDGPLSPKGHQPTPPGHAGGIVYSQVSGVQRGARWLARLTDPGSDALSVGSVPVGWPVSALVGGTMATGQVQTAPLVAFYPGTAWAAHGNYGVEYHLTLPLLNDTPEPVTLQLALESPQEREPPGGVVSLAAASPNAPVRFRGPVAVQGLDGSPGERVFHLVQRRGQPGPLLGAITLAPGEDRTVVVRLVYPADATPPQVLSLLSAHTLAPDPHAGDPRRIDVDALIAPLLEGS
ncbi:MAG: DUF3370 domain-containing protein [Synechococcus sp. SB0676_bin_10]|uniref:DUF3370 domain-containing protein n=1 Tax=Synechococcus sp. SB0676_bin_10 TaxID=2604869 RepID=A0A6B1F3Z3_9SYNE|nr:DUF3370 domain-containing protein [Synechococcus sp. SB0664_bin_36]MYG38030.1 DUF3370 domain-containing protein [Synechococcus sp. SB0676_bin_10]